MSTQAPPASEPPAPLTAPEHAKLEALLTHIREHGPDSEGVTALAAELCQATREQERERCIRACRTAVYGRLGSTTMGQVADWCAEEIASGRAPFPGT